ncbi:MAG: hypothetical protein M1587_07435 [Thaumarchaeota archaeon]|nr:hypothetical protein [Nitrososphaerota archaeon]
MHDLVVASSQILRTCVGLKNNENVAVMCDKQSDTQVINAFRRASISDGAEPRIIYHSNTCSRAELRCISQQLLDYDVVVDCSGTPLPNEVYDASKLRIRGLLMYRITPLGVIRGAQADSFELKKEMKRISQVFERASEIQILSGNNYRLSLVGAHRSAVLATGIAMERGELAFFPAGVIAIAPLEKFPNGEVLVNGAITGIGLVKEPFKIGFKNGRLCSIEGTADALPLIQQIGKRRNGRMLSELGCGVNRRAKDSGTGEDERVKGSIHIGLGDNSQFHGNIRSMAHVDLILRNASLSLDGKFVIRNGVLVY